MVNSFHFKIPENFASKTTLRDTHADSLTPLSCRGGSRWEKLGKP
jgi:hypothetical protein